MAEQSDEPAPTETTLDGALVPDPVRAAGPAAARHGAVSQFVHAAGGRARLVGAPGRRGQRHRQADRRLHAARGLGRGAAAGRPLSGRHRDPHPQDVQAARRQPPPDRAGGRADHARSHHPGPALPARRGDRRARPEARRGSPRDRRAPAQHQEQLPAGRAALAAALRRPADPGREHHRPGQARRLHRLQPRDHRHADAAEGTRMDRSSGISRSLRVVSPFVASWQRWKIACTETSRRRTSSSISRPRST